MNKVLHNVETLLNQYGSKINTDNKLLLAYWKIFDKVEFHDKESFSTVSWMENSTCARHILDARMLIEEMRKEGLI